MSHYNHQYQASPYDSAPMSPEPYRTSASSYAQYPMGGMTDHSQPSRGMKTPMNRPAYATAASDAYNDHDLYGTEPKTPASRSKFDPRGWRRRTWIFVAVGVIVVIIAAVVGGVVGSRSTSYPNYTPLNYSLQKSYAGDTFFDDFNYFNKPDPAQGAPIIYDSKADAEAQNVTGVNRQGHAYIRLNLNVPAENNVVFAHSARIVSSATYNSGLFLFDVYHTPYGCGSWPAVWLSDDDNWPNNGEIDIIEATNKGNRGVQSTLHSTGGCTMDGVVRKMSGTSLQGDCHNTTNANTGCAVQGPTQSFGEAFNNANGGAYAVEWRSEGIRVWFWERASLPADVSSALSTTNSKRAQPWEENWKRQAAASAPDPSTWGEALADFPNTKCDIGSHFRNASLIANIDTCGQFAGTESVYTKEYDCPGNCVDYVRQNPGSFGQAYWEFGAWKVYQSTGPRSTKRWML